MVLRLTNSDIVGLNVARDNMYNNKHIWARKIGFGFGENDNVPNDINAWNNKQIDKSFETIGVLTRSSKPVLWPEEYDFSFEERLRRAYRYDSERKDIERSKDLSGFEKKSQIKALRSETDVSLLDVYRFWNSAIYSEDMIKQRFTHFWTNHFTIGGGGRRNFVIGDFINRVIYNNLNSSFENMLYEATSHVGMLDYLDNADSVGEKSESALWDKKRGRLSGLNDNLARELLELHSVSPSRNYTEEDIRNSAKILAGWGANIDSLIPKFKREQRRHNSSPGSLKRFIVEPYFKHRAEPGKKIVLDQKFGAGKKTLRKLINMLSKDDSTARYLSKKLAIHFAGESASEGEIQSIYEVWKESAGDLQEVHKEVIRITKSTSAKKFLWPSTWMFQAIRVSGANIMPGFNEEDWFGQPNSEPRNILEEIGNSFWENRQPDGYSDKKEDWISTEHFDRRVRIATRISASNPSKTGEEIAHIHDFSDKTKLAIDKAKTNKTKMIVALCSPDFMEV